MTITYYLERSATLALNNRTQVCAIKFETQGKSKPRSSLKAGLNVICTDADFRYPNSLTHARTYATLLTLSFMYNSVSKYLKKHGVVVVTLVREDLASS